jgi:tetratricopeptide (TPR) repeat protein
MYSAHIFISHASKDDDFVKELRAALESHQLPVWVDSRNLRGGEKLAPEISKAIEQARQTIVVLSPNTINSPWVRREIQQALAVEKLRGKYDSKRFSFTAPLGPIEADDLRWYLEEFFRWPIGAFKDRADGIAARLPEWGKQLFDEAAKTDSAKDALNAWRDAADGAERRFSVMVDGALPEGASEEDQSAANEAASLLLSLPWELLHDGRGFLFHGKNPVRVRRRLPNRNPQKSVARELPIRILLVSPRPEERGVAYLDHRISAKPLVEAVEALGESAELTILSPPTFAELQAELTRAAEAGQPYDVAHFDGHGMYDCKVGLGGLCFEDPKDADKLEDRAMKLVYAGDLAQVMRDHRIPLVFLEACQSAKTEENPSASVAARLLDHGVTSVVAMSHSVLVETAHRFVRAFYGELARGARIGSAMVAGQRALQTDTYRGRIMGAGDLHLQDWFVPVLYQEAQDPHLVTRLPSESARQLMETQRRLSLGWLLSPPPHTFIGRSRELLKLERLLMKEAPAELCYAVVRGLGGQGKTTLAVEAARWLVRTGRFRRAAFVSLEHYADARGVLDSLGKQLLPDGDNWSVAHFPDLRRALQPIERALNDHTTIIVLDNLESVMPSNYGVQSTGFSRNASDAEPLTAEAGTLNAVYESGDENDAAIAEIFNLCRDLLRANPATRLLLTTREPLPEPFNHRRREITLGALSREDAIELVGEVMRREGLTPKHDDAGNTPQEIIDLVETVNRHARALTLMAREISRSGVRATTGDLRRLMAELHAKHPDDSENSLYASVELSLRRLPAELREQLCALSMFHGGAHLPAVGLMLDQDFDAAERLAAVLIEVGLAEMMPYGHLRLDPALPIYLLGQMSAAEQEQTRSRWAEGMLGLASLLYEQAFQDTQLAFRLTLLELPNLLALLEWAQGALTPEEVVNLAVRLETLLARLGRPQALAQATRTREQAARALDVWSHAQFESLQQGIERMLDQGRLPEARAGAEELLDRTLAAGEAAYAEAACDIAMAYWLFGRVLETTGAAEAALTPLSEAQRRFQPLADAGNIYAEHMASVVITDAADCMRELGRYDKAAAAYEEGIQRAEKLGNLRGAAVGKGNLGAVRRRQKRYGEALESFREALRIFESLGETGSVAIGWHQIGRAHREARQFEQAEQAYRKSLAILVQQQDRSGEARSLNELGVLYHQMGRLEEAATFYRQATDIHASLPDQRNEGLARNNLANVLIKLQRYGESRHELRRGIECIQPFGHAAELWKAWSNLHDLEQATGDVQAAAAARGQAIASYLAYRRAGGESQSNQAEHFALVFQAIQQGAAIEAEQTLAGWSKRDLPVQMQTLAAKLQAILRGDRDPALAADPNLFYDHAVELQLLLEALETK